MVINKIFRECKTSSNAIDGVFFTAYIGAVGGLKETGKRGKKCLER